MGLWIQGSIHAHILHDSVSGEWIATFKTPELAEEAATTHNALEAGDVQLQLVPTDPKLVFSKFNSRNLLVESTRNEGGDLGMIADAIRETSPVIAKANSAATGWSSHL